jgi:hypothetical protein
MSAKKKIIRSCPRVRSRTRGKDSLNKLQEMAKIIDDEAPLLVADRSGRGRRVAMLSTPLNAAGALNQVFMGHSIKRFMGPWNLDTAK